MEGKHMKQRGKPTAVDPYELEWARRHLDYLRRSADPEDRSVLYWMMLTVFVVGFLVYVAADQITIGAITLPVGWRPDFVGDFLYNFGIALWTSVLVVFLLEVAVDLQKQLNARYLKRMEQALGVAVSGTPEETQSVASGAMAQQLEAITHRLEMVDDLRTEVAAVKAFLLKDKP
jgi:hypothetical protein